jgi:hypothetical protein
MVLVRSDLTKRVSMTIGLVLVAALVFSTAAVAQDSSVQTYGGGGNFTDQVADPGDPADPGAGAAAGGSAEAADPGSLPFTGLDVGLAVGGALLLIGLGALVARLARPAEQP